MRTGLRVAAGVAAGYLLGRTRKMRLALMIAAAGITGARGGSPGALLKSGLSQLGSIPEVAELADTAKHELLSAAKAATVAAATKRVEALSGRMQDQLRGHSDEDDADEDTDDAQDSEDTGDSAEAAKDRPRTRRTKRTRARDSEADEEPEDSADEDESDEDLAQDADESEEDESEDGRAPRRRRSPVQRGRR